MTMAGAMKILAGNSNGPLAEAIAAYLGEPLTRCQVRRFADMEIFVEIQENVRGKDAFIVQSTSFPTNDHLMELLIMTDALRRASARRITAVVPYFGYARQDRKPGPRTPISAKLVANLITRAGADRVLTVDLHAGQIQGFFDIPVDNLFGAPVMVRDIKERMDTSETMVVSPDVGGVVRARALAKRIDAPLAIVDKRRAQRMSDELTVKAARAADPWAGLDEAALASVAGKSADDLAAFLSNTPEAVAAAKAAPAPAAAAALSPEAKPAAALSYAPEE